MTAIQAATSSAQQGASIEVVQRVQDQQKADGKAAVSLIQNAGEVQQTSAPRPSGDGTGTRVDVYA